MSGRQEEIVDFYRIESESGHGPYNTAVHVPYYDWRRHPHPDEESPMLAFTEVDIFGFESMDSLREWFDDANLKHLDRYFPSLKYRATHYRVPLRHTNKSERQMVAHKDKVVYSGHTTIPELLEEAYL